MAIGWTKMVKFAHLFFRYALGNMHTKFGEAQLYDFRVYASGQTDRQTHIFIIIRSTPPGGEVTSPTCMRQVGYSRT